MNWGRDLKAKIPGAPNFTYGEYVKSDTATRLGIVNKPNEEQWQCIEANAVYIMQPVRDMFGPQRITSGFRTPELCLAIGSTAKSSHTFGWTTDFEPVRAIKMIDIAEWMDEHLEFHTLIAEYWPKGWIHCSYISGNDSHIIKLKDSNHHYSVVTIDFLRQLYG